MRTLSYCLISIACLVLAQVANGGVIVTVPGTDNPWLAGMPNGSTSGTTYPIPYDSAPANSPAIYPLSFNPGDVFTFVVTGAVSHGSTLSLAPLTGPDGATHVDGEGYYITSRLSPNADGSENGIGDVTAPVDALMGVFLDGNAPNTEGAPPAALNFSTSASINFTTSSPALRQPFFIGDGLDNNTDILQQFVAPAGATRLYFGPMDQYNWSDNTGSFQIVATDTTFISTSLPEPGVCLLLIVGCVALLHKPHKSPVLSR